MRACVLIRSEPHYRREAFVAGLAALGYQVHTDVPREPTADDVLVIWNRYGAMHQVATAFEQRGCRVIVAENGYVGVNRDNRRIYAMALHAHNGRGDWPDGSADRWRSLGIDVQTWRQDGRHVLVAPNRNFGMPGAIMPGDWAEKTAAALRRITDREVRIRWHPGNGLPAVPLADDLRDAWAVVIWSSSVGVEALVAGIPVVCCAPWWICKAATSDELWQFGELPGYGVRQRSLQRLAWAQWSVEEIADGTAYRHLLRATGQGEVGDGAGRVRSGVPRQDGAHGCEGAAAGSSGVLRSAAGMVSPVAAGQG